MEKIKFTKMHGLGNDFVVINTLNQAINLSTLPVKEWGNRYIGIGFDQLLLIEPSQKADFFCRIFNTDGSEAEQCGNGLRCVARFIHEEKLSTAASFNIETKAGIFPISIQNDDQISVIMGAPHIEELLMDLDLMVNQHSVAITVLSVGNPHAVTKIESVEHDFSNALGKEISTHVHFPQGANVGFMQILNRYHIRLRTYERGVGETHACGSNACAAAVAGIANGWLDHNVEVQFRYGSLMIEWAGEGKPIKMTGPATRVFDGVIAY